MIPTTATSSSEAALVWLIGLALVLRLAGAVARGGDAPLGRLLGWSLTACAMWLAAAAVGAFSPIGLALAAGVLLSLIDHFDRRALVCAAGDAMVIMACGLASMPRLPVATIAATAAMAILVGILIDRTAASLIRATTPLARVLRVGVIVLPLLLWVGHGVVFPDARDEFMREKYPQLAPAFGPFFALARGDVGERVELDTGAVGWLTLPPGPPPYRPALFFHGSNEEGAYQRGGLFIRRTLTSLGFAVLAVDERGFGVSPSPTSLSETASWDPLPSSLAAARYLESRSDVAGSVLAVGHSMGATRVLRFLAGWPGASAGIIMGATVMPPAVENERFYEAFLDEHDLEESGLDPDFVLEVRTRYFNNNAAAAALPRGHAPIMFLRFAFDYSNIIEGRAELYAMIPGTKVSWQLRSDHQFGSSRVRGVLTGDWRTMRSLRHAVGRFVGGFNPTTGAPMRVAPRR